MGGVRGERWREDGENYISSSSLHKSEQITEL